MICQCCDAINYFSPKFHNCRFTIVDSQNFLIAKVFFRTIYACGNIKTYEWSLSTSQLRATNFPNGIKGEFVKIIFMKQHWHTLLLFTIHMNLHTATLYNMCELACTTCLATCEDIMVDKLAMERICIDSAVRGFYIYKELRDCL